MNPALAGRLQSACVRCCISLFLLTALFTLSGCAGTSYTRAAIGTIEEKPDYDSFGGYPFEAVGTDIKNIASPQTWLEVDAQIDGLLSLPADFAIDVVCIPVDLALWPMNFKKYGGKSSKVSCTTISLLNMPFHEENYIFKKSGALYECTHEGFTSTSSDCLPFVPSWGSGQELEAHQREIELRQRIDEACVKEKQFVLTPDEYKKTIGRPYISSNVQHIN